jgi:hypothetical protein
MSDAVMVPRAWLEAFRRDTDPTEPIADNGGTVWDMFCHEAAAMLAVSPSVGGWREPVAWRYRDAWGRWAYCQAVDNLAGPKVITEKQPLYAAPPPPSVSTGKAIRKIGDEAVRLAEVQRSDFGPGEDGGWRFTEFMMSRLTPQPAEGCSSDEGAEPAVVAPKDQT